MHESWFRMVECLSSNHPLLNRTLVKFFLSSTPHEVLRNAEKKAELLGGPWHRGPSIRGFGDVIPGARGSGRSGAEQGVVDLGFIRKSAIQH